MAKEKHINTFIGGMNTVLAPDVMENTMYTYMLNCNVTSTADGNVGIITNPKGNIPVQVLLPEGENKTIGIAKDEESNKMYFAVWNSLGFHSWYQFDSISLTVKLIFQSITFTGGEDILKWEDGKLILHANVIDNNLLYWVMDGHPARKFNIQKAVELSDDGYGSVILEDYVRAAKKTLGIAPEAEYFTNDEVSTNDVFGNLFQFAARYIYDDGEYSVFSDFSNVAVPAEEKVTGGLGIPKINNGIRVRLQTGGKLVKKIELAMRKTNQDIGGATNWVSIAVLDKEILSIGDNTEYEYEFYNNNTYLSLVQDEVTKQQSDFPRNPKVQEFTYNRLVYGNYEDGFAPVKVDFTVAVEYSDLFVPDGTANVLNNPELFYTFISHETENSGVPMFYNWRKTEGKITVGPDVKSGNIFKTWFTNDPFEKTIVATLNDSSETIATQIRSSFANHQRMDGSKGSYVSNISTDGAGYSSFTFKVWNESNKPYIDVKTSVTPVNYSTLKDTGNSVINDKLGATHNYAIRYENEDDSRSLAYGGDQAVTIKTINELGDIKKVTTVLTINHKAPSWAKRYSIVRTKGYSEFIQMLVQKVVKVTDTNLGEAYHDVILGSLFAYQKVHPDAVLKYEFKKGDRIRQLKVYSGGSWSVPSNLVEYEVLDYFPEVRHVVKQDVVLNGAAEVRTAPDPNNVGNNIIIQGHEREIVGITSGNDGYILNSNLTIEGASATDLKTFPSFEIVNRRGVLRIKMDPDNPIQANGSDVFSLVEVYKPLKSFTDSSLENYYDIGYKFEIYQQNGEFFHRGNSQDQTASQPAVVRIGGVGNYVRNRELITNNSEKNPQMILSSVEDIGYSDFYVSDLSSYGRQTRIDDSRGVVRFDDRLLWSDPFIEDTKINGLNMFSSLNRVDYNDKYGSIQRIIFYEGRLYIFKFLKTGWVPVLGSILTDTVGNTNVAITQRLLPDKMEYFLWEGGVGNSPESVVKEGNSVFGVSPTSEVIFEIGGAGVMPASKMYGIDNEARELITKASKAGVNMIGFIDRKNNRYGVMIPSFNVIAYADLFNTSNSRQTAVPDGGGYSIVSAPANGSVSLPSVGVALYSPNLNFSGMDYFSYKSQSNIVRNVCVNVLSEDTQLVWKPSGQYCVTSGGTRTGESGYSVLQQYDNISQSYTGVTKPNVSGDPDYVAPVMNTDLCPIGLEYSRLMVLSSDKSTQNIQFTVLSDEDFNIQIRQGQNYSGSLIAETGVVSSGTHNLTVPVGPGECSVYILVPSLDYSAVKEFTAKNAYIKTARFIDLNGLEKLHLDQSDIPKSHNLVFNALDISTNLSLTDLLVVHHRIPSFNFTPNTVLEKIDVSYGLNLTGLTIGSWSALKELRIHESSFTASGYTPSFINSILASFDAAVPLSSTGYVLQYGENNTSGVKPSSSATTAYNSLIAKGVQIIGKSPQADLVYAFVSEGDSVDGGKEAWVNLSTALTVPVNFTINIQYREGGTVVGFGTANILIPAGELYGIANTGYIPDPGQTTFGTITSASVTPNPAGGITINITY